MRLLIQLKRIKWVMQFFRYTIVGTSATIFQLLVLSLLNDVLKMNYLLASIIAFVFATTYAFSIHNTWSFKQHERQGVLKKYPIFISFNLFILLLNTACLYSLVDNFNLWPVLGQAIVIPVLGVFNFLLQKFITFDA